MKNMQLQIPKYSNNEVSNVANFKFIANDGNGNDCEFYKSKTENSYLFFMPNGNTETLDGLSKINQSLYKNIKNEIESNLNNKKRIKNKI